MGSSITIITGSSFKFHSDKIFLLVGIYLLYICVHMYVYIMCILYLPVMDFYHFILIEICFSIIVL